MKKLITSIIALLIAVIASSQTAPIKPVYVKTDSITTNTNNTDLKLVGQGTGLVEIEGAYTLPGVDGTSGYLVKTDGSGAWGYVDPDDVGLSVTNNTNNYMLTATGGSTINGEANMTFDASTLTLAADLDFSGANHNITNMGDVIFQTGATGGTIQTGTSNADKWQLQAYDVDGSAHQTVASAHAGNDVLFHLFSGSLRMTDESDNTKRASFDLSGITTGTTRAFTFPDQAGTFALTSDLSSFGTVGQIPYTNSAGDNYNYTPNLRYDGELKVGGSPVVVDSDIGVNVQAWDQALSDISGLTPTDGNIIVGNGTNWVAESGATARTSLGFTDPILDKGSPGAIGGDTPAAGSFTTGAFSSDITTSPTNFFIKPNTSDASDDKRVVLLGGGANSILRGAAISAYGNEYTSNNGNIVLNTGSGLGANGSGMVRFLTNGIDRGQIDFDGSWSTNGGSLTAGAGSFTSVNTSGIVEIGGSGFGTSQELTVGGSGFQEAALFRDINTNGTGIGRLSFYGDNSSGTPTIYAGVRGQIVTNTAGSESGQVTIEADVAGSFTTHATFQGGNTTIAGSLTSGPITSTALTGTGTRLMNVTSGGAVGDITNGTDGQVMTMVSGSPAWSDAGGGDVTGPASSTDNAMTRFDGTTGKIIQNSSIIIADEASNATLIHTGTSDGSDNKRLYIASGGSTGASRGAGIQMSGNESAVDAGDMIIRSGTAGNMNLTSSELTFNDGTVGGGNLLLGVATGNDGGGDGIFTIGNAKTVPVSSVTNGIILYAEDEASSSELKVRDEAGNITVLSPHNFSMIPEGRSEEMAWSFYSERDGKYINVDMAKAIRTIERQSQEIEELKALVYQLIGEKYEQKKSVKLIYKGTK